MQLSAEEVLQLSPDDSSAKAAKGLVVPAKWPRLEYSAEAVWGECQGSGSKPYQVQVDRSGPAFRCSCPSRKFPCKHGLALLLLLAQHPTRFSEAEAPAWVTEWLAARTQRSEKQEQKKTAAATSTPDPVASARREATRQDRMQAGLAELNRWLSDQVRQGLAQLQTTPEVWDALATRMVDAQLPGVAYRLRCTGSLVGRSEDWAARVLGELGRLQLLGEAFKRIETLPETIQADIKAALGLPADRDAVLATATRLEDEWLVLGQSCAEDERLWVRRVWLHGQHSGRDALLLDYAHGSQRFEQGFVSGSCIVATLAFFPGNAPLRALLAGNVRSLTAVLPAAVSLASALEDVAAGVAANPWQSPRPLLCSDGIPDRRDGVWLLRVGGHSLNLRVRDEDGWQLLANAGGQPLTLFGEWDGRYLRPLSAWNDSLVWTEEMVAE